MDNKNNKRKRRQSSSKKRNNSSLDGKENTPKHKKVKTKKRSSTKCPTQGIAVSKQLAMRKQKTQVRKRRSNETKMCPNGKPMPSLADLEQMYEDTDSEEQSSPKPETPKTHINKTKTADEIKLLSPNTVSKMAERLREIIENTEPTELLAQLPMAPDTPLQLVLPPKKRKKNDIPYIVGCKDRAQVPSKPTTSFCKGGSDYGVDSNTNNSDEEDQFPNKRRKKSKIGGFSKSIFNAQSDEIAEKLKTLAEIDRSWDICNTEDYGFKAYIPVNEAAEQIKPSVHDSDESLNSSKTVDYDFNTNLNGNDVSKHLEATENNIYGDGSSQSNKTEEYDSNASLTANSKAVTFSPLPSTSRDNETFMKNDKLFNDSLLINNSTHETEEEQNDNTLFKNDNHSNKMLSVNCTKCETAEEENNTDVQIVEIPCETIIVNDEIHNHSSVEDTKLNRHAEIIKPIEIISPDNLDDDDCILIDDSSVKIKEKSYDNLTTIIIDDEYSNINIDDSYKGNMGDEIIDIDSLIEENKAIIEKIQETKRFDSVIEVVEIPNSPSPGIQHTEPDVSPIHENTNNYSNPSNVCHSSYQINNQTNISNLGRTDGGQNSEVTVPEAILSSSDVIIDNANVDTQMGGRNAIGDIVTDFFRQSQFLNASNNVFTRIDNLINTLDCLIPQTTGQTDSQPSQRYVDPYSYLPSFLEPTTVGSIGSHSHSINLQPYITPYAPGNIMANKKKKKKTSKISETQVTTENLSAGTDSVEKGPRNFGDCPICMDSLSNNVIASTICGHVFCLSCIKAALKTGGKRCPTCRKALKGTGYHQLYL